MICIKVLRTDRITVGTAIPLTSRLADTLIGVGVVLEHALRIMVAHLRFIHAGFRHVRPALTRLRVLKIIGT